MWPGYWFSWSILGHHQKSLFNSIASDGALKLNWISSIITYVPGCIILYVPFIKSDCVNSIYKYSDDSSKSIYGSILFVSNCPTASAKFISYINVSLLSPCL